MTMADLPGVIFLGGSAYDLFHSPSPSAATQATDPRVVASKFVTAAVSISAGIFILLAMSQNTIPHVTSAANAAIPTTIRKTSQRIVKRKSSTSFRLADRLCAICLPPTFFSFPRTLRDG